MHITLFYQRRMTATESGPDERNSYPFPGPNNEIGIQKEMKDKTDDIMAEENDTDAHPLGFQKPSNVSTASKSGDIIDLEPSLQLPRKKRKFEVPRQMTTSKCLGSSVGPPAYQSSHLASRSSLHSPVDAAVDQKSNVKQSAAGAYQWKLSFPSEPSVALIKREVGIPNTFQSLDQYVHLWRLAISEEVNMKLAILAKDIDAKINSVLPFKKTPIENQIKEVPNQSSSMKSGSKKSIEDDMRRAGIAYHRGCHLELSRRKPCAWKLRKRRTTDVSDEDSCEVSDERMFLKLKDIEKREKYR